MGPCPFCGKGVERDILVNGGRCPHCLIEIPGEEAATNPGEGALAQQAAESRAARPRWPLALGFAALLAAGAGGGWWALQAPLEAGEALASGAEVYKKVGSEGLLKLNLDEDEPVAAAQPVAKAERRPARGQPRDAAPEPVDDGPDAPPPIQDTPDAQPQTAAVVPSAGRSAPTASLADPFAGLGGPADKGPKAQEACGEAIRPALKAGMDTLARRLTAQCTGWEGNMHTVFVITREGKVADLQYTVSGPDSAEFVGCFEKVVRGFTFGRFCEDVEPEKTFRFGA